MLRTPRPLDSVKRMSDTNDFSLVSFDKDRERAFDELAQKSVLVTGWTATSKPLFFQVQRVDQMTVSLTIIDGDGLSARDGDAGEFLFSIDEGQYHWRTEIHRATAEGWSLSKGGELFRLQRRSNFRTTVPKGYKASLLLKAFKTHTITPTPLELVDVSAGGVRVRWPSAGLSQPSQGDSLSGIVGTPGGRQIEVFGIVKSVLTDVDSNTTQIGVEFQNLSGRDEQALLHLCLQIRRHSAPALR
jgi:c-di-GMP-binding flagellar brake protein YcgR